MDDMRRLKDSLDSKNMFSMIAAMPDHLEEGIKVGQRIELENLVSEAFHSVVIAGMGGSAIGGDIVRSYLYNKIQIPLAVCRHYRLPGYVNRRTLVICSSYSGNTEETLAAYDQAMERQAKVIVISTGGRLGEKALADGIPFAKIQEGLPPRAALGFSFAPLLIIISRLGLCDTPIDDLLVTAASLRAWAKNYAFENDTNPAVALAREILGKIPVIYAGYERLDAVATRFKGQISENAKTLAFSNFFPELNHNELVGWHKLFNLDDKFAVIILKGQEDHRRIRSQMDIVGEMLTERGIKVIALEGYGHNTAKGKLSQCGELERIFYFIQYLDFTSYYLALLNGVDPYPIEEIDRLKKKLSGMN